MAPTISPGKSWEGFAGLGRGLHAGRRHPVPALLDDGTVWQGIAVRRSPWSGTATLGDLGESMLKRDIGIKDMGNLLPGHGGIMDRLDSLLVTAPVAWLLLTAFA